MKQRWRLRGLNRSRSSKVEPNGIGEANRVNERRFSPASFGPILVGVWAISAALATAFDLPFVRLVELQAQTLFFNLRGPVAPLNNIVILAIDDDSLTRGRDAREIKELKTIQTWPWRRTAYADVVDKLMAAGAKSVSIDILFDLLSERPADDKRLQETLQRYPGRVTLAAVHASSESSSGGLEQIVYPDPMFRVEPRSIGFINFFPEVDGRIHRFFDVGLRQIDPGLGQAQPDLSSFGEVTLNAARLPHAPLRGEHIFFYGGQNTFPTVSFWLVLYPKNWELLKRQQVFKDKIVLIGPTAEFLQDIHSTPFGRVPGIEIHANVIATLLEDRAIWEVVPNPIERGLLLFIGIAGVGVIVAQLSKRATPRFLVALAIAVAWAIVSYVGFTYGGFILPVIAPVIAIGLTGISYLGTGAVSDQLEKLRLRRTLERYVSAPIVREILSQPEDFQALLQGRKLKAAVLFCDIRGFTSLSYKLPAEQLIAQLNAYLNAMVQAIGEARGTIDKFIGDAVMAEFGSPVSQGEKQDAMNAIYAALSMRRALAVLRQQWQQQGKVPLYHGIGISYGEVIAGNIGSLQRLEYTVIGDTVNIASRVEGLTKSFWTDILITESLYCLVQDEIEAVYVGEHALRGREDSPTRLYSLISLKSGDSTLYHQVHEELRHYLGFQELQEGKDV